MQKYEENPIFSISIDSFGNQIRVPSYTEENVTRNCCSVDLDVRFIIFIMICGSIAVILLYFTM